MREMKNSGIEWIGDIPAAWKLKKGKFLFAQRNEKGNSITLQLLSPTQKYGVIPQSLYEELSGMKAVKLSEDVSLMDFKSIYSGDFCISLRSFQGGFEYSQYNGVVSPAYQVFYKTTEDTFDGFYRYMFKEQGFIAYMTSFTKTFRDGKSISFLDFSNSLLPLPPFAEQKKIAEFLDHQCAEIDAVIAKTKATIEEYKKLKQSIITEAVTKGVRGDRPMKISGIEWIGDIPFDWEISRIKYVSEFEPSSDKNGLNEDSVITYTPMDCIKNGWFINQTARLGSVSSSLTAYQNGDIVMAKVTPCFENGNIAIMENLSSGYGLGSSELFVFRAKSIDTKFLFYWLRNDRFMQSACSTMTGTGGLKRVSPTFIKNCYLHLPPVEEQKEIANYLDKKCAEMDTLIDRKTALLAEMETYKKSVIYEYVTGKKEVK